VEYSNTTIAPMTADDLPFAWKLLSDAAQDAGLAPLSPITACDAPFGKYLTDGGRSGDAGVIAHLGSNGRAGAAWYRLFPSAHPGYGFVAPDVPEISIRLLASYRGQGIGSSLLRALVHRARQDGYRALSLSVNRENPARRLYMRHGFLDIGLSESSDMSVTMIKCFAHAIPLLAHESGT
jgi:ribosomal protein S18 acetylase RimI-like enzyme